MLVRETDIHEINVIGIAGWLSATGARILAHEFDHFDGSINVLAEIHKGTIPAEEGKGALKFIIRRRTAVLRPKIKSPGHGERVPEYRSGSNKRSSREARGEVLLPAAPAIPPENSDQEELDGGNTLRYRRASPNEKRLNRRLRCRVCRQNPARGAAVPSLMFATATLCVACFIDRHPQYVDSMVKIMVVDMKGKRGMNENGDLVAGEIVSETIIGDPNPPQRCEAFREVDSEIQRFESGFTLKIL